MECGGGSALCVGLGVFCSLVFMACVLLFFGCDMFFRAWWGVCMVWFEMGAVASVWVRASGFFSCIVLECI